MRKKRAKVSVLIGYVIEELKALMATDSYRPEVKQAFIFACFTGLRLSDMYKLAPIHIFKTPDGKGLALGLALE